MTDDTLPTASLLPIGQDATRAHPQDAEDREDWDVVHEGTADTPDHGAQALMRTSDGDFRISAAEVDGKVGLKIERLHPHGSDHEDMGDHSGSETDLDADTDADIDADAAIGIDAAIDAAVDAVIDGTADADSGHQR